MNLYVTLGRKISSTHCLEAYREGIANFENDGDTWPLCLRPSQRAFVTSTLCGNLDPAAHAYLVQAVLASLSRRVPEPLLLGGSWLDDGTENASSSSLLWDIPLSLHDARIFLTAFSRLSLEDQTSQFVALLIVVERLIHGFQATPEDSWNVSRCAFVARVITLVTTAYAVMKLGTPLRQILSNLLTDSLPILSRPEDPANAYWANAHYMGVFSDWENSALPIITFLPRQSADVQGSSLLERVLEQALQLGFATAQVDSGHILFAAWNAHGKRDLWSAPLSNTIQPFVSGTAAAQSILQLRDEMCSVHRQVQKWHGESLRKTALMLVTEETRPKSALAIFSLLRAMIEKASAMIDALLDQGTEVNKTLDPDVFCLLEACAVYITFAVSAMTKPRTDFFSATVSHMQQGSRLRGYSTDSEAVESVEGSRREGVALTLDRIRSVCDVLGAAPAHPDWLDCGCRLLEHLAPFEASKAAQEAQLCLTKLLTIGLVQSQNGIVQALSHLPCRRNEANFDAVDVAAKLCRLRFYPSTGISGSDSDRSCGSDDIAAICCFDVKFVESLVSEIGIKQRLSAKKRFVPFSRQCMHGKIPDWMPVEILCELRSPELKVCGEWDLLLSSTLTSACINVHSSDRLGDNLNGFCETIALSERWRVLSCSALDALVPTAALLRFALSPMGRVSHPLSFTDVVVEGYDFDHFSAVQEHCLDVESGAEASNESVIGTLVALANCPPCRTCDAVATHLVVNPNSFATLQGMVASAHALQALEVLEDAASFDVSAAVVPRMIGRVASILESFGSDGHCSGEKDSCSLRRFCVCLFGHDIFQEFSFNTVASLGVDPLTCLSQLSPSMNIKFMDWEWKCIHRRSILCMLKNAFRYSLNSDECNRRFFTYAMAQLLTFNQGMDTVPSIHQSGLLTLLVETCNSFTYLDIEAIVHRDICGLSPRQVVGDGSVLPPMSESLSTLFAFVLSAPMVGITFLWAENVYKALEGSFSSICKQQESIDILNLLFLYSTWKENLHNVGAKLFEDLKLSSNLDNAIEARRVSVFVDFVGKIASVTRQVESTSEVLVSSRLRKGYTGSNLPTCCSYVLGNDFREQHWYHCYTCGLTNDKGCCTLCAVICHRGHDVAYSRFSPFFCDCGGDDENKGYEIQGRCKCLTLDARDSLLMMNRYTDRIIASRREGTILASSLSAEVCSMIARNAFMKNCLAAIEKCKIPGVASAWFHVGLECCQSYLDRWKYLSFARLFGNDQVSKSISLPRKIFQDDKVISLHYENVLSSGYLMIGTFQSELCNNSLIDKISEESLLSVSAGKHILDADSRGRLVVVESFRLVFFSGFCLLNSQPSHIIATNANMTNIAANVSCFSSIPTGRQMFGAKFASDSDNVVCAWGQKEAKVLFLNRFLTAVDLQTNLTLGITNDDDLPTRIVNCCWLAGSNMLLAVGCNDRLFIFDLSKMERSLVPCVTVILTVTDSNMQDFVVVRVIDNDIDESGKAWKIFATVENECIQEVVVRKKWNGPVYVDARSESPVSSRIEASFHTSSICSILDSELFPSVSPRLVYLEQSNLLLFSSGESDVIVVILSNEAIANRCFKLIPFHISSSLLGRSDDVNVSGPFTLWKESGYIFRGDEGFIRLSCVGRLEASNEDVLLFIEFNSRCASVKAVIPEPSSQFSRRRTYEGLTVFTAPYVVNESYPYSLLESKKFKESVVLCAFDRKGCFEVYVEEATSLSLPGVLPTCLTDINGSCSYVEKKSLGKNTLDQSLRIISIEDLKNVSDSKDILFGGGGFAKYVPSQMTLYTLFSFSHL